MYNARKTVKVTLMVTVRKLSKKVYFVFHQKFILFPMFIALTLKPKNFLSIFDGTLSNPFHLFHTVSYCENDYLQLFQIPALFIISKFSSSVRYIDQVINKCMQNSENFLAMLAWLRHLGFAGVGTHCNKKISNEY